MGLDFVHLLILNAGLLLLVGLALGHLASFLRLPRVTGYLIAGIVLGPSFLGYFAPFAGDYILSRDILDIYLIITEIGLGFIIFNVGGEFKFEHISKIGRQVFFVSLFEIVCTFVFVFVLIFLGFYFFYDLSGLGLGLGDKLSHSVLLGVVAIATAPAATLLVLREYESEGPITDYVLVLIGLNNIVCITLFKFLFSMFFSEGGSIFDPFAEIFLSIALGIGVGFLVSFAQKWLESSRDILILVIGGIAFNIGLVSLFETVLPDLFPSLFLGINISNLLANLFMGITLVNSSTKGDLAFSSLKRAEMPIYVLFFVIAGASLHLGEILNGGILFILYVVGRSLGKYLGPRFALKRLGLFSKFGNNLGKAILPQAGVAIGLAFILQNAGFAGSELLVSVILSGVIVFEFFGPIFTRFAIVSGGEVKEISLSKRQWEVNRRLYQRVLSRLDQSLGFRLGSYLSYFSSSLASSSSGRKKLLCKDIMRSSVDFVLDSASFDEVLAFASKSKYDKFSVVDRDGHFVGIISYSEIRDILMDDEFVSLIIAKDIAREEVFTAHPENSIQDLVNVFHASGVGEFLPVIDDHDPPHLIGMVTQKDAIALYNKRRVFRRKRGDKGS